MKRIIAILFLVISVCSPAHATDLLLFGGAGHDEYLGCMNCSRYDSDSICSRFGSFGNRFSSSSIWNRFGTFGNRFNIASPWNKYSSSDHVPVLVDHGGRFYD